MGRVLLAATAASFLAAGALQAQASVRHHGRPHGLPPLSGTLRMTPHDFGAPRRLAPPPSVLVRRRAVPPPDAVEVVRGGAFPQATLVYGGGLSAAERWATGGTGLSGLIGNTGNPYAGEAAWGTADSATAGLTPPPRFAGVRRGLFTSGDQPSLSDRYGEAPVVASAYDLPAYGSAPAVPFYGTGVPSSMSYYSSGSSAGPYGSPGGLGVYRSGSYGFGPRIVTLGGRTGVTARQGCTCGPRVLHLGRRHHLVAR